MLDVDLAGSAVVTTGRRIGFDFLIVATGARHAYFGHDEWEPVAPGLKQIDEAMPAGAAAGLRYPEPQMKGVHI